MNHIPQLLLVILRLFGNYPLENKAYKYYLILLIAASVYSFYATTNLKENVTFEEDSVLITIADTVFTFFLMVTSITSIVYINFLYPNRVLGILDELDMSEELLRVKCSLPRYKFWIFFMLFSSSYVVTVTFDAVVWTKTVGLQILKYYMGRNVQIFQVDMLVLLKIWLCLELWSRFKALNNRLGRLVKRAYLGISDTNIFNAIKELDQTTTECRLLKIRKLKRLHNLLCNTLQSFNGVYGLIILLEIISAISLIVEYTLIYVYYFVIHHQSGTSISFAVDGLLFMVQSVIELFALAAVGQLVYYEAHDTIAICYRGISELEAGNQPGLHFIKKELLDLIHQVHIRDPKIASSSFFDVKLSMIGFAVASITSYIIVALQFMLQEK